ncbi:methyltransferase type 12 [Thecamonas trahens ATCC 50062]|uniref:Methyltransferase type 12 n=1 Tax=Thecamonas trahens ATCC 50062 TaxID=461836 RepID=A0A0L0D8X6_THETB|nr:methyltransferase type 12 [Thecamonas trahens ATCC 50062]KNC48832.1 methyltransferase type 12 [Thecamonas trahens ATCC 50062]|eukprot:XP_013758252.1 methyltransferase type 12 [Thecamonas trahens ATCC 50062]
MLRRQMIVARAWTGRVMASTVPAPGGRRTALADGQRKVPRGLARAIAKRVKSVAAGHLKEAGAKAYAASGAPSYNSALAATAFMAHRSPAVYAATERVLDEMVTKLPSDILADVRSSIDFGAGSCASTWALNQVLPQAMDEGLVVVEPSPHMMDAGLATLPDDAALHSRISARVTLPSTPADLVLASYVLCDLPSDNLLAPTIDQLWAAAGKVLVVVEPGTPQGYARIMAVRDTVIASGSGSVVAPCPHSGACPLASERDDRYAKSWCHFALAYERTPIQRALKSSATSFSREKFSYLIAAKTGAEIDATMVADTTASTSWSKIISPPLKRGKHVIMDTCAPTGDIARLTVTKGKSGRPAYRHARKARWGDDWLES